MRVLSVIIAHPLRKVSGATNAGRQLSIATSALVDLELAIMWDANELTSVGKLGIRHMQCSNLLGPFARFFPRFLKVPLYTSRIPELVRHGKYDLVHIHNLIPTMAAEQVARACTRSGTPYVISTHGFDEISRYAQINSFGRVKTALAHLAITRPFERIVQHASGLFALSDRELPLLSSLGVDPRCVSVVTNGVDDYFLNEPSADEQEDMRERFHLERDPILLFFGSLHAYKGVDTFLKSLIHVTGSFQPVVAGKFKDASQKAKLLRDSQLPDNLASRVIFTGGVTDQELRSLYYLASVFAYPTRGDSLPLVVLEAMACGLPVVSTPIGGIPFAVRPETGRLVPPDEPAILAQTVSQLLADPALCTRLGRAGRERVEQMFQWEAAAHEAAKGYCAVLDRVRPGHSRTVVDRAELPAAEVVGPEVN